MIPMKPATQETAAEAYRKSARFHHVCQAIVAEEMRLARRALDDCERDPYYVREVADRIATGVAARVLQTIYEEDAEIAALKTQIERLTALITEGSYLLRPPTIIMPDP
jgi:hypothetical protein